MAEINLPEIKTSSLLWANRPEASSAKGEVYYFTDIGPNGSYWISNGEFWSPVNGEVTLFSSGVETSITGTLLETTIAAYTLPGGIMSKIGSIDLYVLFSSTNSANSKTLRVRHSDVGSIAGIQYYNTGFSTISSIQAFCSIKSNNSTIQQKGYGLYGVSSGLGLTASIIVTNNRDMTLPSDITLTGQLSNTGEFLGVAAWSVIYRG